MATSGWMAPASLIASWFLRLPLAISFYGLCGERAELNAAISFIEVVEKQVAPTAWGCRSLGGILICSRTTAELRDCANRVLFSLGATTRAARGDAICVHDGRRFPQTHELSSQAQRRLAPAPSYSILQHVNELLDDQSAMCLLDRQSHQRPLSVLAPFQVVTAEQLDKPPIPSASVAIRCLVVSQGKKGARCFLLRFFPVFTVKQAHQRHNGTCLSNGKLQSGAQGEASKAMLQSCVAPSSLLRRTSGRIPPAVVLISSRGWIDGEVCNGCCCILSNKFGKVR